MENSEENVNYENLDNEIKEVEEKYDIEIKYTNRKKVPSKLSIITPIVGLVSSLILLGTVITTNVNLNHILEDQNMYTQEFRYVDDKKSFAFGNKVISSDSLWLLFDFENKEITFCTVDYNIVKEGPYSSRSYQNFYDAETGEKIFTYLPTDENSESYKMVENKEIGLKKFTDVCTNLSYNKITGKITCFTYNINEPEYTIFYNNTGKHKGK